MIKRPVENQEQIELLQKQVLELKPGSEEQLRAVNALSKLQEGNREQRKTFWEVVKAVGTVAGTAGSLFLSYVMFKKPYDMQKQNVYVTDRQGQENIRDGKSGVKDVFRKLTR